MTEKAFGLANGGVRVGCAGWAIPTPLAARFPGEGSHLARYARVLSTVEINSSFYRPHRPSTYARWAASVPEGFVFSVKVPKEITHSRRLVDPEEPLDRFLAEARSLGDKLGPLLVQLPPSLKMDPAVAGTFLTMLRDKHPGPVALEARHASWFSPEVEALLVAHRVARVGADPAPVPGAEKPAGFSGLVYVRLHGSPRIYHSAYEPAFLDDMARRLLQRSPSASVHCIFDNTASGAAPVDALSMAARVHAS
ncbi:DUF72 domain-containing protein [Polyangium aurulentum]|uniref:DUF72 domain-containing protein n=1 Tax=Polyangium aurulentum TaxID=2567896 RepID=UPI0010ADB9C1|nr:DUF72 domain-containing protein [Polyangium aurulentum]UQA60930.1 DUF72 domain-containing protein [Polyangium aurulentum]